MKGLTLTQPWASLITYGEKRIETRGWAPQYCGPLAIHAAKGFPREAMELCFAEPFRTVLRQHVVTLAELPRGAIVAVANLWHVEPTDSVLLYEGWGPDAATKLGAEHERAFGNYAPGRFAWFLRDIVALLEPVPTRGALSLWELSEPVLAAVEAGIDTAISSAARSVGAPAEEVR